MTLRLLGGDVLGLERNRQDRRTSTVSIVTHLSEDRLHQLTGLCAALIFGDSGSRGAAVLTVCAAVLVQSRIGSTRVLRAVRALPGIGQQFIIRVQCFARVPLLQGFAFRRTTKDLPQLCWYPINQLRNKALAQAETDLVLICDVDFRPCQRLLARFAHGAGETALLKRASCRLNCVVLPAFEVSVQEYEEDGCEGIRVVDAGCQTTSNHKAAEENTAIAMPERSFWTKTLGSKLGLLDQWNKGLVLPFASQVWPQGHRATNFDKWKGAHASYEAVYEEGFEPFVIMNRLLVPTFDERFEGYGRNKVIFFYRLHALGFSFTVEPDLFLVHAPHERSESWRRTFGRDAVTAPSLPAWTPHSERFAAILDQYRVAKAEVDVEASERRHPRQGRRRSCRTMKGSLLGTSNRNVLGSWSAEGRAKLREHGGAFATAVCSEVLRDTLRHALLSSMHALWYEYHPKSVDVVARIDSRLDRGESQITIFTQCSLSRLRYLERMCGQWTGVISAAVIAEGGGHIDRKLRRQVAALHARVESGGKCRLDISLCEHALGVATGDGLYPVNALRNVALSVARTDLVLSLDIDKMPMRGLHEVVSSPTTYNRLFHLCRGSELPCKPDLSFKNDSDTVVDEQRTTTTTGMPPTFVVVPALEFAGAISPDDPRIQNLLEARDDSKRRASDLVARGALRAFHAGNFPEGHRQTNLDRWAALAADATPYEVKYAEGYEPYGLFFRRHAPPFDERFRGFGLDKVSHCWHLRRLGWSFRALPAAYLIDMPHPPTKHRQVYQTTPAFRAAVDGLFQRFTTEIVDRPLMAGAGSFCFSSSSVTAPARTKNACRGAKCSSCECENHHHRLVDNVSPRDYEVLVRLSLLAWGDAWMSAGSHAKQGSQSSLTYCGGGWELKGSDIAWAGLRAASMISNLEDDDVCIPRGKDTKRGSMDARAFPYGRDRVAFPPRMVGGWAYVGTGGQQQPGRDDGNGGFGLHGRSVIRPHTSHGVIRYWVHPRWDPENSPRGKLPGLGMSGDVRFFVRWHTGSVGFCSLMVLGRPLKDICEVHVIRQAPFPLERDRTTAIQLEADMRRTPDNGGALSFRAWADGFVVYEARVYASDSAVSGGEKKGMWVEDALLHVYAATASADVGPAAAAQYVLVGGVEVWGKCSAQELVEMEVEKEKEKEKKGEEEAMVQINDLVVPGDVVHMSSMAEKLRFVFVASTGRCGTHFLSRLLATAPGVLAVHEAAPTLSGHDTLLAAATSSEKSYAKRRHKADCILRSAQRWLLKSDASRGQDAQEERGSRPPLVYVETSHLFLKTFSDVVMRELAPHFRVDVVVLHRNPAAVLKSRVELGHFCGRHKQSDWLFLPPCHGLVDPTISSSKREEVNGWGEPASEEEVDMDGFEALIAYAAHTDASIRNFRSHYEKRKIGGTPSSDHNAANYNASRKKLDESLPQPPPAAEPPSSPSSPPAPAPNITATTPAAAYCNVFEASLELLQTELGVRKLFADLNLRVSEECTWSVVEAGATNTRGDEKRRTVPLEYCMQRIISNDRPRGGAQG